MQRRRGNSAVPVWLAFGGSAALHVALAAFLIAYRSETHGVTAPPSEAISVNIETSDILHSPEEDEQAANSRRTDYVPQVQETKPVKEAETDQAPPPEPEAKEDAEKAELEAKRLEEERERLAEEEAQRLREQQEAERQEAERRKIEEEALAEQRRREQQEAEQREADRRRKAEEEARLAEQRRRLEEEAEEREAERRKVEQAERVAREEARKRRERRQGRNAAEAAKGEQASRSQVSASRGAILNYGTSVRAKVARNTPKHSGRGGRVTVIQLKVSPSGSIASVRVLRSSGDATLDQKALADVRRSAPFPPPPQGIPATQLIINLSFSYR